MRVPLALIAASGAVITLAGATVVGCDSQPKSSTPTTGSATSPHPEVTDYTTLLIKASDIGAPEPFTASPAIKDPNGQQGATTTFTDQDHSHAVIDTIQILLDPAAAANALDSAKQLQHETLQGKPLAVDIGVDGTTITGTSQDRSKGITVLLFTEGKAFVTLQFEGPSYALAPPEFVTGVGEKQDAAIKKGLGI
jgi:hypothetical protein